MTVLRCAGLFFLVLHGAFGQNLRLTPGAPRRFSISPQAQPFVLTGVTVFVPGGSSRLVISLEPDVLEHDMSLWARFDREVVTQSGAVTAADFSSQNIGVGREQIVITGVSSPPLQTGNYYIAIGVATLNTAISGTITATIEGGGTAGTLIVSTFDQDLEGWTRNFPEAGPNATLGDPGSILDWVGAGGFPGGFLRIIEANGERQDFVVAPPKFLGNLAAMTNARLEFDYQHQAGSEAVFTIRVRVLGAGGTFEWTSAEAPSASWTHYRLPLDTTNFRRASGSATMAQALSNVTRIEISMDQAIGAELNGLDNFALIGDMPPSASTVTPATPVISTFDADTEGWGRNYPPVGIRGASSGDSASTLGFAMDRGSPGGAVELSEIGDRNEDFFVAPAKFLGNLAGIQNPQLEFDYSHTADPTGIAPVVVRVVGAGSSFLWIGATPAPFGQYQHYRIPLTTDFFVRESGTATFAQALAVVQRIEISAEQAVGSEMDRLDNVTLVSSSTPALRPTLAATPSGLAFNATAGESNPPSQTFRITSSGDPGGSTGGGPLIWSAAVDPPAPWLSLSVNAGTTPTTLTVSVNAANLAAGNYSTRITITATGANNTPQSVNVSLTVAPSPASLPRITGGSVGNAASFRSPVAVGALATLFGANVGPAEGVSTSFLPGTQRLPTTFRGVRVLVRDAGGVQIAEAPLLFISSTQINFQMPFEAAGRASVVLLVDNNGQLSGPETVSLAPAAPGLFTSVANRAVVQNQDFSLNTPANPAPRGGVLIAYLTGQGPVSPAVSSGQAAPPSPLATATMEAAAAIGGVAARVLFLGLTPGLVGVAQANILVPDTAPAGDQTLLISVGGQAANAALVSIR